MFVDFVYSLSFFFTLQNLKLFYQKELVPLLIQKFNYNLCKNIPKITKIILNRGIDESCQASKVLDYLFLETSFITGQAPFLVRSKNSISSFKVRQNMPVGIVVTLRGKKLYYFLDRLLNLVFPRVRDFQGLKTSGFDKFGNFSFSFSEQYMFPEVDLDKLIKVQGLDIVIVIKSSSFSESYFLLKAFGVPF